MDSHAIDEAAGQLAAARTRVRPLPRLADGLAPATLEEAYAIQERLAVRLAASGLGPPAGFKIGCTTAVMQDYLKIPHPCAGIMFQDTVVDGEAVFSREGLCRPGVECEIAVRLASDVGGAVTPGTVAAHVDCAMASIELVDSRWEDFSAVPTATLVADNFFNAGCVLGPPVRIDPAGLAALSGEMRVNGQSVGSGRGADILGDPMAALAWLAGHRAGAGRPLRAGDVVTLGSLVKTAWIGPGDRVEIEVERLGHAALAVG